MRSKEQILPFALVTLLTACMAPTLEVELVLSDRAAQRGLVCYDNSGTEFLLDTRSEPGTERVLAVADVLCLSGPVSCFPGAVQTFCGESEERCVVSGTHRSCFEVDLPPSIISDEFPRWVEESLRGQMPYLTNAPLPNQSVIIRIVFTLQTAASLGCATTTTTDVRDCGSEAIGLDPDQLLGCLVTCPANLHGSTERISLDFPTYMCRASELAACGTLDR